MKIPKQFTIHEHTIKVIQKEIDNSKYNRYGYYNSIRKEIVIFTHLWDGDGKVTLTETQLTATFLHELMHCLQWHIKGETNEWEAQSYSGLIVEFLKTREYDEHN